jgi:hypothetical protein
MPLQKNASKNSGVMSERIKKMLKVKYYYFNFKHFEF